MGTRADFYVGRGRDAEWLGSIAWDGHPKNMPEEILSATTEDAYRAAVAALFQGRTDVTRPDQGWPWPWSNSCTTDYAYAFDRDGVYHSIGFPDPVWWSCRNGPAPSEDDPRWRECEKAVFPNMATGKNVRLDGGSGLIISTDL